jgi:hypothetical protein
MRMVDGSPSSERAARSAGGRLLVLLVGMLWTSTALLGWWTTPARARSVGATAPSPAGLEKLARRAAKPLPRIRALRALDTRYEIAELETLGPIELARFAAKRWTHFLADQTDRIKQGAPPAMALDDYFAGWQAVTAETSPYSAAQFEESLRAELCGRPQQERDLLRQSYPALAAAANEPCTIKR